MVVEGLTAGTEFAIPYWLIITFLIAWLLFLIIMSKMILRRLKEFLSDRVIIIDKNNRYKIYYKNLKGKIGFLIDGKTYPVKEGAGLIGFLGKGLYIFSDNKPSPALIDVKHSAVKWLDARSLTAMINNKIAQDIVKPTDKLIDLLIIAGACAGIVAGISSLINLAITTGIIGGAVP